MCVCGFTHSNSKIESGPCWNNLFWTQILNSVVVFSWRFGFFALTYPFCTQCLSDWFLCIEHIVNVFCERGIYILSYVQPVLYLHICIYIYIYIYMYKPPLKDGLIGSFWSECQMYCPFAQSLVLNVVHFASRR